MKENKHVYLSGSDQSNGSILSYMEGEDQSKESESGDALEGGNETENVNDNIEQSKDLLANQSF